MSYLRCARCDVELFDDPHTDTDLADVCGGCCTVCNPTSEPSLLDDSDAPAGMLPAGATPDGGSGSPRPPAGPAVSTSQTTRNAPVAAEPAPGR